MKKTTYDLLMEIKRLGFTDTREIIMELDKTLDDKLGRENRLPLQEEYLPEELYSTILATYSYL